MSSQPVAQTRRYKKSKFRPPLKVLIVEDERLIAENLKFIVEDHNYEVVEVASSGEEAVHKAQLAKPDLILMDVRIQGELDGVHAASLIQEKLGKKARVLFLSAHSKEQFPHINRLDSDSFLYLKKPYTSEELLAAMESVLNS